jgi:hypothetical protein
MLETITQYIPLPYTDNTYEFAVIAEQISRELVTIAHIPTALIALALAYYLWKNTKNLASLYLFLLTVIFGLWSYFDLLAWTGGSRVMYFGWSMLAVLGIILTFLCYWFLYAFIKKQDVPLWQKIVSLFTLVPPSYAAFTNTYLSNYYNHSIGPTESDWLMNYMDIINIVFLAIIVLFTLNEIRKAANTNARLQILYAGLGVFALLFVFTFSLVVANILHDLGYLVGTADNAALYSLFGMPIMVAFLTYTVAKHGAFGMKILKSVGYVILLMILLFIAIFI